ncbi:MAG: hypothetical protein MUE73_18135, partial [Planctomycetes bacterium]|nr:hypothetical protein [Planctomycetota bacterium]
LGLAGACASGPSVHVQVVDDTPLADLKLPPDLRSLRDVLCPPVFNALVLDGKWVDARDKYSEPECVEWFTWGEVGLPNTVEVWVQVYDEPARAAASFEDACRYALDPRWGGGGGDRHCVTEVRRYRNEVGWPGSCASEAIFLKGRIVIAFRESSDSTEVEKGRRILGLANTLRPLSRKPVGGSPRAREGLTPTGG